MIVLLDSESSVLGKTTINWSPNETKATNSLQSFSITFLFWRNDDDDILEVHTREHLEAVNQGNWSLSIKLISEGIVICCIM